MPGEDAEELELLRQAVACDWHPRDAYERHWAAELVAAMWRQQRLRQLEFAALEAASQEHPPSEASLKRLLTFARYGARIDKELAQALRALRVLKARSLASLGWRGSDDADSAARTPEPDTPEPLPRPRPPTPECTREPDATSARPAPEHLPVAANRHERRRLEALDRKGRRRAA